MIGALQTKRLTIHCGVEDDACQALVESEIKKAWQLGSRDVGVFAHSNIGVAKIAELLDEVGIDHALIGIPEAHSEALGAMASQCAYAVGMATDQDVRESLALFLTATVRGSEVPFLAHALIGQAPLPDPIEDAIHELEEALGTESLTIGVLTGIAMNSWEALHMTSGRRPWRRAAAHFRRLSAPVRDHIVSEESVRLLIEIVDRTRAEALVDRDYSEHGRVKLMTYHQTKGREADTVIHVFQSGDYFGSAGEPFEAASRLLNVAISRARKRVVIILPPVPHALVEPFTKLMSI